MENNFYQKYFKNLKLSNKTISYIAAGAVTLIIFIILLIINVPNSPKVDEPSISTEITQVDEQDITENPTEIISKTTESTPEPTPEPEPEPTPEPEPEPEPAPKIIGEDDFCSLFHIKVLEVAKNVQQSGNNVLIRATVEIKNTGSYVSSYNTFLGHIEYKESRNSWTNIFSTNIPDDELPTSFSLQPGETRTGYVYDWVPKDKTDFLRYKYDPSADGDCIATIELQ